MAYRKNIAINSQSKYKHLHIEAPGCIINIYIDEVDRKGQPMTTVNVYADTNRYAGEYPWYVDTDMNIDSNEGARIRVVQYTKEPPLDL